MKKVKFSEFMENLDFFVQEAKNGKIFIYPTDTIYGIWWVWNEENIKKISGIKNRDWNKMFSVIAPNFDWILDKYKKEINTINEFSDTLNMLNWAKIWQDVLLNQLASYHWVTWIFDYNKPGVRIIKHDFQSFVEKLGEWFITTSVNVSWEPAVTNLSDLKPDIVEKVDYIIDNDICEWRSSVLLDFVWDKVIER